MSSPADLSMTVETLIVADAVYGMVEHIDQLAANGNEADARHALGFLAESVREARPGLRDVIAAQLKPAQAQHRTKTMLAPFFPRPGSEHPHAANDHGVPPEQPSPSVA